MELPLFGHSSAYLVRNVQVPREQAHYWPSSRRTRVSTIVSWVSPERVEFRLEWRNLTFWTRLLSTLLQPRVSRVPKWRKARCKEATENVFYHFICLLVCTFVKCVIKLWEIKWTSKIYLFRHLAKWFYAFSSELSMKRYKKLKTTWGTIWCHTSAFSLHWIKSKNHHICSFVEGKMAKCWSWGFYIPKVDLHS